MGHLPDILRPTGIQHRDFVPGYHLAASFYRDIKSLDSKLHFVWHPWKIMYDNITNQYTGGLEDPRFSIHEFAGEEVWGWPLKDHQGAPVQEAKWHLWRLCWPYGWCHIVGIETDHSEYLSLLINRLHLQAIVREQYGDRAWNLRQRDEQEEQTNKDLDSRQDLFDAVQDENKWLVRRAAENFERGQTAPTNPKKETIVSYAGQKDHSRTVRPLDDTEGGLYIPDKWR